MAITIGLDSMARKKFLLLQESNSIRPAHNNNWDSIHLRVRNAEQYLENSVHTKNEKATRYS
jgi:hypothetical protein